MTPTSSSTHGRCTYAAEAPLCGRASVSFAAEPPSSKLASPCQRWRAPSSTTCLAGPGAPFEAAARRQADRLPTASGRSAAYVHLPWVDEAGASSPHPGMPSEALVGPEHPGVHHTFFIKEPGAARVRPPGTRTATYFGLAPLEHVTAWVGADRTRSETAGCMGGFCRRGGAARQQHARRRCVSRTRSNGGGQAIVDAPRPRTGVVAMALPAGSFSLHQHAVRATARRPNRARAPAHRHRRQHTSRPASSRPASFRMPALLVRGNRSLSATSTFSSPPAAESRCGGAGTPRARSNRRYRENYNEQVEPPWS